MTKKLLKLFAEEIKNNVAYQDHRNSVADAVIEVAKKSDKKFTKAQEIQFLRDCGLWD